MRVLVARLTELLKKKYSGLSGLLGDRDDIVLS